MSSKKLDAKVAKIVFEYPDIESVGGHFQYRNDALAKERGGTWISRVPDYSTTWEGVGLVIEEMKRRGWECVSTSYLESSSVAFRKPERDPNWIMRYCTATSFFVAVCEAAIKARKEMP